MWVLKYQHGTYGYNFLDIFAMSTLTGADHFGSAVFLSYGSLLLSSLPSQEASAVS